VVSSFQGALKKHYQRQSANERRKGGCYRRMNIAQKYMEEKLNKQKSEHDSKNHCACINGFQVMSTSVVTMEGGR
jgi:hypothetical protein